jgi:hypothetical protein
MRRKPVAGSHPEEHYLPATRKRMHLDKPTSHGGWPEGEYDPPVADRLYRWYKKMEMMPENDEVAKVGGYVTERGNHMRITESMLRRIIREEYSKMNEADDTKGAELCKSYILKNKKTQSDKEKLASDLKEQGVTGEDAVNAAFEAGLALVTKDPAKRAEYFNMDYTLAADEIAGLQKKMNEGQRGNDENGQHDNDTDPGDPHAKKLREARILARRRALLTALRDR